MGFWLIIAGLTLAVAGLIGLAALRGRAGAADSAAYDLQIYRDQLNEVERDLARGVLEEAEAERTRTEISRRILAADAALGASTGARAQGRSATLALALATASVLVGGSYLLYDRLGAPGYRDLPIKTRLAQSDAARAARMTQAEAEERLGDVPRTPPPDASPEFLDLMEKLREAVERRPEDLQGLTLLARNEAALGNAGAAYAAQARIIALKGDAATATDHAFLADLMITAAAGYVSQEAETALRTALDLDPREPIARYYLAQYLLQVDRPDAAFRLLEELLRESAPDAPWLPSVRAQIEEVAYRAGVNYELPPETRAGGPSAEDIAAASDMTAEDRQAMIQGMVDRLSARLAEEGGSAAEWAQLIRALGVLERYDQARSIYAEGLRVFEGRESELEVIRAAGRAVGVNE